MSNSSLYDFLTSTAVGDESEPSTGQAALTLPPGLENYLPPEMWRKLTEGEPRRGVLLNSLERLRSLLHLLSTYLPAHLVQEKMRRPIAGRVDGQELSGSLLFSDVSGFTALAEKLAVLGPEGAERLTAMMNRYFETMLEILSHSGGILLKFAGDATLVYFPEQEEGQQADWAVRAGHRMMAAMSEFSSIETPLGPVALRMKIGIATGHFLAASVGTAVRMEYVVLGETVTQTMGAEGAAEAGLVVVDSHTAVYLNSSLCTEQAPGYFAVAPDPDITLDSFEIKAEARRARGAMPWNATPHAMVAQMEVAIRQIEALAPYLATELASRVVSGSRKRQIESEYRPTTVMFINFTGIESILAAGEARGARAATQLLNAYFNAMHQIINRYGGVVTRIDPYSKGSKMLVLFGAPIAHEDDPQRAVSAALAMRSELTALTATWRQMLASSLPPDWEGPLVQQRVGITQGLTFAGEMGSANRREYTVMGDDVNLAARLMGAGQPGQILLSKRVYDAVAGHFAVTALTPIMVKGKSQPIPIFQADGLSNDPLAPRLHSREALLGRENEWSGCQARLRQSFVGQGHLLTIAGAAGMGKSHLADHLAAYGLKQQARVLFAQCYSYTAAAPYAPWVTLCRQLAGIDSGDNSDISGQKLHHLLAGLGLERPEYQRPLANLLGVRLTAGALPAVDGQISDSGQPAEPPPKKEQKGASSLFNQLQAKVATPQKSSSNLWDLAEKRPKGQSGQMWQRMQTQVATREQARLFRAVHGLMWRLAADSPLMLYFENAQWMDPVSQELLSYLSEHLSNTTIFLLLAQRGELADKEHGRMDNEYGRQTITLPPLSLAGTAAMVNHLLGAEQPEVVEAIYEQSGGNPLFIEELSHWLQRAGPDGRAALKEGLRTSNTIQELVLSRVDSLPPAQRDTAKVAAVIGSEFRYSELRALLPSAIEDTTLHNHLSALQEARLILLTQAGDEAQFAFRQTLIREVLYDNQPFSRRRELHATLAAYLEKVCQDNRAPQAELLAYHYEQAALWLPAASYLILSGHKARERYAYRPATGYYDRALAALDQLPPAVKASRTIRLVVEAQEGKGDVALLSGDYTAAVAAYEPARAILSSDGSPPEGVARLLLKLALVLPTQGEETTAVAYARQVWESPESDYQLTSAVILAWLLWRRGDAEAGQWIEQAGELAQDGRSGRTAAAAALLADLSGDWPAARKAYQALQRRAAGALAACRLGDQYLEQGDLAGAAALFNEAAQVWEEEQDGRGLALARYRQAEVQRRQGHLTQALSTLQEMVSLLGVKDTAVQEERQQIQQAIQNLDSHPAQPLPAWQGQSYDDSVRISLLFHMAI